MGKQNLLKVILKKYSPILVFLIITQLISFLLISCEDEVIQPPPKPPGYQEDIAWPSLAESPWPIEHADPQNTGRGKHSGPKLGIIEKMIDSIYSNSGVVVGLDSTIYFSCSNELKAIDQSGNLKWRYYFGIETLVTPLIGNDGTVYTLYSNVLIAINPNGVKKWETPVNALNCGGMNTGKDGILYFADSGDHTLYAYDNQGNKIWSLTDSRIMGWNQPIISPDGNSIYLPGNGVSLVVVNLTTKQIEWSFGTINCFPAPIVDCKGNIYINSNNVVVNNNRASIFSLEPSGKIRWFYSHNESVINGMALDKSGNLIFGSDSLYSINYSGALNWKINVEDFISVRSICCDVDCNIYTVIGKNTSNDFLIQSYNSKGQLNYEITNGLIGWAPNYSPALFYDKLIVPTQESNVSYIIK
jgi:hypothetical protein